MHTNYPKKLIAKLRNKLLVSLFAGVSLFPSLAQDTTPPTLLSRVPLDNSSGMDVGANIVMTFDEDVQAGTGFIRIRRYDTDYAAEIYTSSQSEVVYNGSTVTIERDGNLILDTEYYIEVQSGAIEDLAGNDFGGVTDKALWNFTTEEPTPPEITGLIPLDNSTGIPTDQSFTITFDEPITGGTTYIAIRQDGGSIVEDFSYSDVTIDNNTLSFTPSSLLPDDKALYITINGNSVFDLKGAGFATFNDPTGWNFSTGDAEPPVLQSTNPADDAEDVALDAVLSMTFDEEVFLGANVNNLVIREEDGTLFEYFKLSDARVSGFGTSTISINPTNDFDYGKAYYVNIPSGEIEDGGGYAYDGFNDTDTWSFEVLGYGDVTPPEVVSTNPLDDATDFPVEDNLTITFSEDVKLIPSQVLYIRYENGNLLKAVSTSAGLIGVNEDEVIINPYYDSDLPFNAELYVEIPAGVIEDLGGNDFEGLSADTWTFTTEAGDDVTPPEFTTTYPADDATEVPVGQWNYTIAFDEDIIINPAVNSEISINDSDGITLTTVSSSEGSSSGISTSGGTAYINFNFDGELDELTLDSEEEYHIKIGVGFFADLSGNSFTGIKNSTSWSFFTEDVNPPVINGFSPNDNETELPINFSDWAILFDEQTQIGTGTIDLYKGATLIESIDVTGDQVNHNNATYNSEITFELTDELDPGSVYHFEVSSGIVQDNSGNEVVGFLDETTWNFTAQPDESDPPVITYRSPTHQSTDNSLEELEEDGLYIEFDEYVKLGNGSIELRSKEDNTLYHAINMDDVSMEEMALEVGVGELNNLPYNTEINILICSTCISDVLGNAFSGTAAGEWYFKTERGPLELLSLTPENNVNDAPVTSEVSLRFSHEMEIGTGTISIYRAVNDELVSSLSDFDVTSTTVEGKNISFEFPEELPTDEELYIQVSNGYLESAETSEVWTGIQDKTTWTFTILFDPDPPVITALSPLDESSNFLPGNAFVITYNEDVIPGTGSAYLRDETHNTLETYGTGDVSFSGNQVTINPGIDLEFGTAYEIVVTSPFVTDQSGNSHAGIGSNDWTFTTKSKTEQSITFEEIADQSFSGQSIQLEASASSGLEVSFSIVSGPASINEEIVEVSGTGTITVAANQPGNDDFFAAEEVTQSFLISKGDQNINITSISDKQTDDEAFEIEATVDTDLLLTYSISGPAELSGQTITLTGGEGTVEVTVSQAGNSNYNAAESSISFEVTAPKSDQTISFNALSSKTFGDADFSLQATSTSGLEVQFEITSGPIEINDGVVTILGAGSAEVLASQPGDGDYNAATPVSQTFEISKADQVISIDEIGNKSTTDDSFAVDATSNSGLSVTFEISGPASIEGNLVTLTGTAGTVVITASQGGDDNYNEASAQEEFEVQELRQNQEITFPAIEEKVYGVEAFELSATSSSGLPVNFALVSGPVSVDGAEVTILGAGEVSIEATQAGDENYFEADPVTQVFTVAKASQIISIDEIDDKYTIEDPFEVSAATNSGLSLEYSLTGPAEIDGNTVTLSGEKGEVTIVVSQSGNDNYEPAEKEISFNVLKKSQTITFEEVSDKVFGDTEFMLVAESTSELPVSFSVVAGNVSLSGSEVQITGAGEVKILASQAGDLEYEEAEDVSISFIIEKADQVITIEEIEDQTTDVNEVSVIASTTSGLDLVYSVDGPASNIGNVITLTGEEGMVTVKVSQEGDVNFNVASAVIDFEVVSEKQAQLITFEPISDKIFGDPVFELVASTTSGLEVDFALVSGNVSLVGNKVEILGAGEVTIVANQVGNESFDPAEQVSRTFTVLKADQEIIIIPITDKTVEDSFFEIEAENSSGLPLSFEITGPASLNGNEVILDGTVGQVKIVVSNPGNENYNAAETSLSFNVIDVDVLGVAHNSQLIVYPNPAHSTMKLELDAQVTQLNVFDSSGKSVNVNRITMNEVDVSTLPNGNYILLVRTDNRILRRRFVKH